MRTFVELQTSVRRAFGRVAEHRARQGAIRELSAMPGWRLRDLGVDRGRIPEIVDGLLARKRALQPQAAPARHPDAGTGGLDPAVSGPAV